MMVINKEYLNNCAKWGVILGMVMSCSRIIEMKYITSHEEGRFVALSVEYLFASIIYLVAIYQAIKLETKRVLKLDSSQKLRMSFFLNYAIFISILVGLMVGITSHIYINNVIGGYDSYMQQSLDSVLDTISIIKNQFSEAGSAIDFGSLDDGVAELRQQSATAIAEFEKNPPSIFTAILSSISDYIVSGFIFGGLFSFIITRKLNQQINGQE